MSLGTSESLCCQHYGQPVIVLQMFVPRRNQTAMSSVTRMSAPSMTESVPDSGRGTASVSMATSSMTLRERIAHIERQLSVRKTLRKFIVKK